jgi:hypothetical protein
MLLERRTHFTAALVLGVAAACSSSTSSDAFSQADADTFADLMMADMQESGVAQTNIKTFGGELDTSLSPLASCTPQRLTPVRACPAGGNIYTTVNQTCPDANLASCCGANPACSEWKGAFSGQYKTLYNGCKTGPNVEISGTWNGTMTGSLQGDCGGQVLLGATIRYNGNLSVRVNGREACEGFPSLEVTIFAYGYVQITMSGRICGRSIFKSYKSACFTQCDGFCCPGGSICSKTGKHCWPPSYPVDCGDYACPAGTQCAAGNKCQR